MVLDQSNTGITGSNPTHGVLLSLSYVDRGIAVRWVSIHKVSYVGRSIVVRWASL